MTNIKDKDAMNKFWMELPYPGSDLYPTKEERAKKAEQICKLANNALGVMYGYECTKKYAHFFWHSEKETYCFGGIGGYTYLNDNGSWMSLDYFDGKD